MNYKEEIDKRILLINNKLDELLVKKYPEVIYDAMKYSVSAGGKRVRPLLLLLACEAVGGSLETALPFACALEMIHTYSLIHDDLPAMDNDDFRRGKPTNHKVFGEAVAILSGDGLLNFAYEVMLRECVKLPHAVKAAHEIAVCAGVCGMIGGQVADILSEGKQISSDELDFIHYNKAARLFQAAFVAGGIVGSVSDEAFLEMLCDIGVKIGFSFQIKDDILDLTSDIETLGKPIGSDERNEKATFVSVHGMEKAVETYNEYYLQVMEQIKKLPNHELLAYYAEIIMKRDR